MGSSSGARKTYECSETKMSYFNDPEFGGEIFRKVKKDQKFIAFLTCLSLRDRLIARVMYYGFLTPTKIISLKVKESKKLKLPQTVMSDLLDYVKSKHSKDLCFSARDGSEVNRTHLINAFSRASKKVGLKITPSNLTDIQVVFLRTK